MEGQTQEHSGEKQQFGNKGSRTRSSVHNEPALKSQEEKQKDKEAGASDIQSKTMSDKDQTRVAKLAYDLYEQGGRRDGQDLEDWFKAERRLASQGA